LPLDQMATFLSTIFAPNPIAPSTARQVPYQEYPLVRGLLEDHGVFQDLRILGVLGELDHVASIFLALPR
jgi:hypothetical protein